MRILCLLLLVWVLPTNADNAKQPIRFGLTAVVVTENLRFLDQWSDYLELKTGRKVEFVLRKSYRDVMDLLETGSIDFAWICGYPFVQERMPNPVQLMTVPVYRGLPKYHSYIIVPSNSPYQKITDLKGKVFAFSDPDSNSGFLYPLSVLEQIQEKPKSFFRQTFFTYNHAETVQAVAEQFADAGAVDSYIWDYLSVSNPEITERTRIIKTSQSFGFPPIVSRAGTDSNLVKVMKETLENMDTDPQGKILLARLKLDGFDNFSDSIYEGIKIMAENMQLNENGRIANVYE